MSLSDDWRERHGQKQSGSRVIIYIILLLAILFFIARSGNFSRQFAQIFMGTRDSTAVEPVE
ncbi:MAG: hypothetical protein KAR40_01670 [Candidatus Sabulitectum sp.]|nr:hypothetical protein [Candidatus Sabulitectum sp.]